MKTSSALIGFVAIAVFAIVNFAAAATIIGADISTDGSLSVNSPSSTSTYAGRLGIGTSSPWGNGLLTVGTSSPLLYVDQLTGSVGIGTAAPGPHPGEGAPGRVSLDIRDSNLARIYLGGGGSIPSQLKFIDNNSGKWFSFDYDRRYGYPYDGIYMWRWDGTSFYNVASYREDGGIIFGDRFYTASSTPYIEARVSSYSTALSIYQAGPGDILNAVTGTSGGTSRLIVKNNGNVGIGTTSPATQLQVSSGANATTTVTVGELGLTSSKGCVNMNRADGGAGSFYINAAGTAFVVEPNYCR